MFPIGDLKKDQVKKIAREAGLERIAQRKEVQSLHSWFFFLNFPKL